MIELRVYASLLSRRAQTFLLTVQSVLNCRDNRLLEKLPKAEFSLRRAFKNAITRTFSWKAEKTFGAYELKVDRTFDETNDSMWISKRIWTIEETLLRIDGNLVFLHFIRRRSDWIVKTPRESQRVYRSLRHLRHVNYATETSRYVKTRRKSPLGENHQRILDEKLRRRNGIHSGISRRRRINKVRRYR